MSYIRTFILTLVLALVPITAIAQTSNPSSTFQDSVPAFELTTYNGDTVALDDFKENVLVINIWATWCPFCTDELPAFAELQKEYPNQARVIAINRGESVEKAKHFTDSQNITNDLLVLMDPNDTYYRKLGGFSMPETLFVGPERTIRIHKRGPMELTEMREKVEAVLATTNTNPTQDRDADTTLTLTLLGSAFIAGVIMFLAPCTLPLVPAYLGFISGVDTKKLDDPEQAPGVHKTIFVNGLMFTIGFSIIFVIFGTLAGLAGSAISDAREILTRVAGVFVIIFGFILLGVVRLPIFRGSSLKLPKWLKPGNPLSSLAIGGAFAVGWTPCVGPILASVLALVTAAGAPAQGALALAVFSLGMAIPFLIVAGAYSWASTFITRISKYLGWVSKIGGVFLILLGLLLVFNNLDALIQYGFEIFEFIGYGEIQRFL